MNFSKYPKLYRQAVSGINGLITLHRDKTAQLLAMVNGYLNPPLSAHDLRPYPHLHAVLDHMFDEHENDWEAEKRFPAMHKLLFSCAHERTAEDMLEKLVHQFYFWESRRHLR